MTEKSIPKYQVVRDALTDWIKSGELSLGDRLPTESDLAKRFEVSRQTVRQAVGELVQKGVLERIQGSGTYYKESSETNVAARNTRIVGVVTTYISDYIFPHIIRGIEGRLSEHNFSPLLYSTQNNHARERRALEDILERGVDALIVEATKSATPNTNIDLYHQLAQRGIPVVMIHAKYPELQVPLIEVDDVEGGRLATRHLSGLGHKKIGAIMKLDDSQGVRRLEGFMDAVGELQLQFRANYLAFYSTEDESIVAESYAKRLAAMGQEQRPTAVFCYNDAIAAGLIRFLRNESIKVPNEIAVAGFDDAPIAALSHPQLTTISHPKVAMGIKSADVVLQCLDGNLPNPLVYTYPATLVQRGSTASTLPLPGAVSQG